MNDKDNYYMRRYGCTRIQFRRVINKSPYREDLDGSKEDYEERKIIITGDPGVVRFREQSDE